ncbi:MAG: ROK family transcriptional regulator [Fimbriiglobus sp.]
MDSLPTLRPELVGKLNERRILRIIQAHGPMSRADVVRHSGISAPTVSKAVASLLTTGLVEELEPITSGRGRPAPLLRSSVTGSQVIGVVLDVEECTIVSAGLNGQPFEHETLRIPTPKQYTELLDALEAGIQKLRSRPDVTTLGIGVSVPGLIDARLGLGVLSPNLPMTNGQKPAEDLQARLGLETTMLQESHALCLAERMYGEAKTLANFAMVDVGVGVGLGVMSGGRIVSGHHGFAGEIGHMTIVPRGGPKCGCGNTGCLETVAGDKALADRIAKTLGKPLTVEEAYQQIAQNPDRFREEISETEFYLSLGLAAILNLFNPTTIFLYTKLGTADPHFWQHIREAVRERALAPNFQECELRPASATKAQGALAGIIRHITNAVAEGYAEG